jgi:hypothetical protein
MSATTIAISILLIRGIVVDITGWPLLSAGRDVLVEVEDVVGVVGVLHHDEPGELVRGVGAAHTYAPWANGAIVSAYRRAAAIRAWSSAESVQPAAARYSNAVSRWLNAVASSGTSAIAPP